LRKLDRAPGVRWIKKMIAFPIGERFAVISITAAFFSAQTVFIVLLVWGGFAAAYVLTGRTLRSLAA
jgi:D-alanyl-lipoteichoic acid acyltransferase DltB (MBOAT superfamily)